MDISDAINRIAELSEIHGGNVDAGQFVYRFGIITLDRDENGRIVVITARRMPKD